MTDRPPDAPPVFQTLDRVEKYPYTRSEYLRRVLWQIVQATLFRYSLPRSFGWRRFLLRRFGARMADTAGVQSSVKILHPWLLEIDEWTILSHGTTVYNLGLVKLGKHSVVSQNSYLCAGTHDYTKPTLPLQKSPIQIGSGVWIAAEVFVGSGVNIGDNTVVGARSVVVKDLPPGIVAAGNPAKVIKNRQMDAN